MAGMSYTWSMEDKNSRAMTALILKDFLRAHPQVDQQGGQTDPETSKWQAAQMPNQIMPQAPKPMNKAWYTLPDFFDDMISQYFQFQQGQKTGGD